MRCQLGRCSAKLGAVPARSRTDRVLRIRRPHPRGWPSAAPRGHGHQTLHTLVAGALRAPVSFNILDGIWTLASAAARRRGVWGRDDAPTGAALTRVSNRGRRLFLRVSH